MALNFLNFNENKTEVVFGPCITGGPFPIDISLLAQPWVLGWTIRSVHWDNPASFS